MSNKRNKKAVPATVRIKDPKKVAAGKARAAKSLRVEGKFTSNQFLDTVTKQAEAAGVADPYVFYLQNQSEYEALYSEVSLTTYHDFDKLLQDIKGHNGPIYKNGRRVRPETAIRSLWELNQYLKGEHDVFNFWAKIGISQGGRMEIEIPRIADIRTMVEDDETDIEEAMETFGWHINKSAEKKLKSGERVTHWIRKNSRVTACGMSILNVLHTRNVKAVTCEKCRATKNFGK